MHYDAWKRWHRITPSAVTRIRGALSYSHVSRESATPHCINKVEVERINGPGVERPLALARGPFYLHLTSN
jgi:hypothetical protein